ncbi:MAG: phosphate/phosphite/phosphonate ABC transporter substrate-binding protein [Thaumarchaeota archaeon]|nr:phosphate/phosphite/phosphonate ABC transporter substrate-binding protein [Candidatus Calditenuaceae archaeon]MDW8187636.1 phosphate/phosphite/phosphonate ABC transporter substrate-binding protein [Nitrososphaerota archaeon]
MKRALVLGVVAFAVLAVAALLMFLNQQQGEEPLVIAIQPTQNPAAILERSQQLKSFLSQRLGRQVEVYVPTSYSAVIEALRYGNVHAAMMGSWPSALAVTVSDSEVYLAEVRTVAIDGQRVSGTYYFSYWIVKPESPYKRLEELRGKRVCFPSQISSSGYLAPLAKMVELGLLTKRSDRPVDPKEFFSEVYFGGGYQQCYEALMAGNVDVTVTAGDIAYDLYQRVMATTRVIEQQGPLPSHTLVVSNRVDARTREQLVSAFLELGKEEYRDLMRNLVSGLFVGWERKGSKDHLSSLQRFIELTGLRYES